MRMQEASRAVAHLAPMPGLLMPPTRRAQAPPVVWIVGAPGHCPAAATRHRILEGTARAAPVDVVGPPLPTLAVHTVYRYCTYITRYRAALGGD